MLNVLRFFPSIYALEVFGEIPEPQYLSFLLIVFYRTERLATIFVFIPQGTNFSIVIAFDIDRFYDADEACMDVR